MTLSVTGRDLAEWSPPGSAWLLHLQGSRVGACWSSAQGPQAGEKACGNECILPSDTCGSVTLPHSALSRPWLSQAVLESLALSDQGLVIRGNVGAGCDRKAQEAIRWGSPSHTPW